MEHASATNTSHRLRQEIEDAIVAGQFLPGERLDEVQLATRFSVSRTPIREALHQLAMAGMVEIRPRRGAIVAMLTPQLLYEMFEVMSELESICGRLAARRISEAEVHVLQARRRTTRSRRRCSWARGTCA